MGDSFMSSNRSSKGVRFGVYIPVELEKELRECMENIGIDSRSRVVQEALRLFILEHKWRGAGKVAGVLGVLYNHEVKGIDERLTDIQHEFLDVIVATVHVHLTHEKCMLAIIVKGETMKIKKLLDSIASIRGVFLARPLLLEYSE